MAEVSLAVVNGRIRTSDPRRPVADALAVAGAELVLVGSSAEVRKLAGQSARVVDVRGAVVLALQAGGVLRRGEPASFRVIATVANDPDLLRVERGAVVGGSLTA